ncbi:hypothetical protein ABIC08_007722 [Bradyrhizobium sp. RT9b]|uniref:hypothetical protein n=1 Tax=unclassified Bradyrhizobium TaxID=2631580 RepID=UPI0033946B50
MHKIDWDRGLSNALALASENIGNRGCSGDSRQLLHNTNQFTVTTPKMQVTAMRPAVTNLAIVTIDNQPGVVPGHISGYSELFELRRFLPSVTTRTAVTTDTEHDLNERAAVIEFDGGVPRTWADGFARLDPAHPLADFSESQWLQIVTDSGFFLDAWGAEAARLSWSLTDLFGLDPHAPRNSYGPMGLVFLIGGGRVTQINKSSATIWKRRTSLTYHRPPRAGICVWDLQLERSI